MAIYQIRIKGYLAPRRLHRFGDVSIARAAGGQLVLTGPFPDQAALFGLLNWLHDLGAELVSVNCWETLGDTPG